MTSRQQWFEQRANNNQRIMTRDVVDLVLVFGTIILTAVSLVGGLLWIILT